MESLGFVMIAQGILLSRKCFPNHIYHIVGMVLLTLFSSPYIQAAQGELPLSRSQQLRDSLKAKSQTLKDSLNLRKNQKKSGEPVLTSGDTSKTKYKTPWQRLKDNINGEKLKVQFGDQVINITTATKCDVKQMNTLLKIRILAENSANIASCTCCLAKEMGRQDTYENAVKKCTNVSRLCGTNVLFKNEEDFFGQTKIIALNTSEGQKAKIKVTLPTLAQEGVSLHDNSFERYIWNLDQFYTRTPFTIENYSLKFSIDEGYIKPQGKKLAAVNPYNHHYNPKDGTFFNPWPNSSPPTAFTNAASGILWKADIKNTQRPWFPLTTPRTVKPLPEVLNGIQATMIGHATVLIQVDGVNILTDPIYFDIGFGQKEDKTVTGYKRIKPPGVTFEDLPKLDFIVLSHNHRDHLDVPTLTKLEKDHPQVKYITPLGYTKFLQSVGLNSSGPNRIFELDWWDSIDFPLIRFTALPTQHWSGRSINDVNKMFWSAYAMTTHPDPKARNPVPSNWRPKSIYFAGDTGFGPHFEEIAEAYPSFFELTYQKFAKKDPSFDLSLIPIGAYCPMHKEGGGHINPFEAVKVHKILKSKYSISIHFETFQVAQEPYGEAKKILMKALDLPKYRDLNTFRALEAGEKVVLNPDRQYKYYPNE
jgi:L-ascorbate metabolism protein UlaG (beta-lactamase superfamily)